MKVYTRRVRRALEVTGLVLPPHTSIVAPSPAPFLIHNSKTPLWGFSLCPAPGSGPQHLSLTLPGPGLPIPWTNMTLGADRVTFPLPIPGSRVCMNDTDSIEIAPNIIHTDSVSTIPILQAVKSQADSRYCIPPVGGDKLRSSERLLRSPSTIPKPLLCQRGFRVEVR